MSALSSGMFCEARGYAEAADFPRALVALSIIPSGSASSFGMAAHHFGVSLHMTPEEARAVAASLVAAADAAAPQAGAA